MSQAKIGRPTKEEALTKAIAALGGRIDYRLIDPRDILAAIAADPAASESVRIRACVVLMSDLVVNYTRRRDRQESEEAMRRQWDEADEAARTAMCEQAKANYVALTKLVA